MQRERVLKSEIGERLQVALARQGNRSIRSLEAEMADRKADITSYAAIRSYVKGEKLPPLTFLMEAAEVLSVRSEWLILGEGEISAVEEEVTGRGAMEHLVARHPELERWPTEMRALLMDLIGRYVLQAPDGGFVVHDAGELGVRVWEEVAGDLVFLTSLPLRSWGFRGLEEMSTRERTAYLMSMLNALGIATHGIEEGDSFADHAESLLPVLQRAGEEPSEPTEYEEHLHQNILGTLAGFRPDDEDRE